MAKVIVKINPKNQEREYEVEGMPGTSCEELTKQLIEQHEILEQQYTEEYYCPETLPEYINTPEGEYDE